MIRTEELFPEEDLLTKRGCFLNRKLHDNGALIHFRVGTSAFRKLVTEYRRLSETDGGEVHNLSRLEVARNGVFET